MPNSINHLKERTHVRVNASARAIIDDFQYKVEDWSVGGLRLSRFKEEVNIGDCLPIEFCLSFQEGIEIATKTLIEVVWQSKTKQQLGAKFLNLTRLERDLLSQVIEELQKGEITPLEKALVKTDTFSAIVPKNSSIVKTTKGSALRTVKKSNFKKFLLFLAYLGFGSVLGGLAIVSLNHSARYMEIKSATITDIVEPIISTQNGNLSAVLVRSGMKVEAGQPLLKVVNNDAIEQEIANLNGLIRDKTSKIDELTEQIELSRLDLAEALSVRRKTENLIEQEQIKLKSYQAIAQSNLDSALAKAKSLTVQQQTAQKEVERFDELLQEGVISQQILEIKTAKLAELTADLITARQAVKIAETGVNSVRAGNFYNGNNLVGNLSSLIVEAAELDERVQLASQKINTWEEARERQNLALQKLEQQKQSLENPQPKSNSKLGLNLPSVVYQAPFSGSIVRVEKSPGNTVNRGETLVLLRPLSERPTIDAYLTQDQVASIKIGSSATAIEPTSGDRFLANVIEIDRTGGFKEKVRGEYLLEGSKDQPAHVRLALANLEPKQQERLTGGMPVILEITKPSLLPRLQTKIFNKKQTIDNRSTMNNNHLF
jgi:multidrug resistance efflux pump